MSLANKIDPRTAQQTDASSNDYEEINAQLFAERSAALASSQAPGADPRWESGQQRVKSLTALLCEINRGLVVRLTNEWATGRPALRDEFQSLFDEVLLEAVNRYDPQSGVPFGNYAAVLMRHRGHDLVAQSAHPYLSLKMAGALHRALKMADEYINAGKPVDYDAIADALGESRQKIRLALDLSRSVGGLTAESDAKAKQGQSLFTNSSSDSDPMSELWKRSDVRKWILPILSEQEREVVDLRFGLNGSDPQTFDQIAIQMGLTRVLVTKIYLTVKTKCLHPMVAGRLLPGLMGEAHI